MLKHLVLVFLTFLSWAAFAVDLQFGSDSAIYLIRPVYFTEYKPSLSDSFAQTSAFTGLVHRKVVGLDMGFNHESGSNSTRVRLILEPRFSEANEYVDVQFPTANLADAFRGLILSSGSQALNILGFLKTEQVKHPNRASSTPFGYPRDAMDDLVIERAKAMTAGRLQNLKSYYFIDQPTADWIQVKMNSLALAPASVLSDVEFKNGSNSLYEGLKKWMKQTGFLDREIRQTLAPITPHDQRPSWIIQVCDRVLGLM